MFARSLGTTTNDINQVKELRTGLIPAFTMTGYGKEDICISKLDANATKFVFLADLFRYKQLLQKIGLHNLHLSETVNYIMYF